MSIEAVVLPDVALLRIFSNKSPKELCVLACVCRIWRTWAEDKSLWKKFLQPTVVTHSNLTFKSLFLFSPQYRLQQYRRLSVEADALLNNYLPLDRDKIIEFLTKYPKHIDFILFHRDPNVIRLIDNIVLTHIAKIDRPKIITIVQHLDTRISVHLNRHLLMHFMDVSSGVVPYIINHPHESVIKEINDKLLSKAIDIDARYKDLIVAHTHPYIVRLRQASVIQAKLVETSADSGCRIS